MFYDFFKSALNKRNTSDHTRNLHCAKSVQKRSFFLVCIFPSVFSIKLEASTLYFLKVESPAKWFSCEFFRNFEKIYFAEHLRTATSENNFLAIVKNLEALDHLVVPLARKFGKIKLFQNVFEWSLWPQSVTLLTANFQLWCNPSWITSPIDSNTTFSIPMHWLHNFNQPLFYA